MPKARPKSRNASDKVERRTPSRPVRRPGQPGGVRDTNRRERINALSTAAMQLFLARGIEPTTIDDITQAAGMAKGSFYRYFEDKTALVAHLFDPIREEIELAMQQASRALEAETDRAKMVEAWRTLGETMANIVFSHVGAVRLYLQESRGPSGGARTPVVSISDMVGRYAIELTRKAHAHGLLRRSIHPAVSALAVVGAVERLLSALFAGEEIGNPLEVPRALTSLIMDGLAADREPGTTARS
ncbi:MAG: TetR/AcrR family transcriptional regulator [Myxococcaceae bacterium]|nr:TetR/AcrR family transcriptional regulator [Myxococcaceae bacterium]